ncbi:hypothetical protein WME98_17000 [Sorangium sp. So ce296]|uniref:hypothetical protein n=1 Tax=Sorangium sp. So ce296 TaxID=3133296 RepID=UPI003F61485F
MGSRIILGTAALVSMTACEAAEEPGKAGADGREAEQAEGAPPSFVFSVDRAITAEDAIPQILNAGRPQLAAACAEYPGALIRVFNPLALGAYEDVTCSAVLDGEGAGEANAALANAERGGPIGVAQQELSPFSIGCGVFVGASALVAQFGVCPRARTERARKRCDYWTGGGFVGLGVLCGFF